MYYDQIHLCIREQKQGGAIIRAGATIGTNTLIQLAIILDLQQLTNFAHQSIVFWFRM